MLSAFLLLVCLWIAVSMATRLVYGIMGKGRDLPVWAIVGSSLGTLIGAGMAVYWVISDISKGVFHG